MSRFGPKPCCYFQPTFDLSFAFHLPEVFSYLGNIENYRETDLGSGDQKGPIFGENFNSAYKSYYTYTLK